MPAPLAGSRHPAHLHLARSALPPLQLAPLPQPLARSIRSWPIHPSTLSFPPLPSTVWLSHRLSCSSWSTRLVARRLRCPTSLHLAETDPSPLETVLETALNETTIALLLLDHQPSKRPFGFPERLMPCPETVPYSPRTPHPPSRKHSHIAISARPANRPSFVLIEIN